MDNISFPCHRSFPCPSGCCCHFYCCFVDVLGRTGRGLIIPGHLPKYCYLLFQVTNDVRPRKSHI
ncbi:uncharacterized protein B0I36DRAFT_326833 [Microdochium trichocladiopsis]|uniref:Uncharacterized protein n=1 Tax=Microdochium trichocladiopsis TaxID=1682393 RepID=A0A9P9BRH6_9PEZI|nr:uncharacterized protein B0I36DRAFT_326833 [Microdochium trichocladiopsis]KAH7027295.1 hypothetical protein B0I36DRAFT_326833 [Microdochium trichocladiopsis]